MKHLSSFEYIRHIIRIGLHQLGGGGGEGGGGGGKRAILKEPESKPRVGWRYLTCTDYILHT